MLEQTIESDFLKEKMNVLIYLPEAFSPMNTFHVCIMQDGDDYFQLGRVATVSDKLHDEADIEDTVFVGIHYRDKYDRRKKYHPNGEQQENYFRFLTEEVVPKLDPLLPHQLTQSRALMGDSLAGTLALMTAMRRSDLFSKVIIQSPYVNDLVMHTVKQANTIHTLEIYHTIGTAETNVQTLVESDVDFLTPNRELYSLLKDKGPVYHYKEIEAGKHTWKYWQEDMPHALQTMFE